MFDWLTLEFAIFLSPRKDHRGVHLISDALPFGRLTLSALRRGLQLKALSVMHRAYLKD
jgi:hypothetical protein